MGGKRKWQEDTTRSRVLRSSRLSGDWVTHADLKAFKDAYGINEIKTEY